MGEEMVHWLIVTVFVALAAGSVQVNLTWFQTKDDLRKLREIYHGHVDS